MTGDTIQFRGNILNLDGKKKVEISETIQKNDTTAGKRIADELLKIGGKEILEEVRSGK
jgi:porphobilinogen deaminase